MVSFYLKTITYKQGRIIHRRDWASALGHQPIGGHDKCPPIFFFQVIMIMTTLDL